MKKNALASLIMLSLSFPTLAADGDMHNVTILGTSDLHGHFMPWDYAADKLNMRGSLSQIATKVADIRSTNKMSSWSMRVTPFKVTLSRRLRMKRQAQ